MDNFKILAIALTMFGRRFEEAAIWDWDRNLLWWRSSLAVYTVECYNKSSDTHSQTFQKSLFLVNIFLFFSGLIARAARAFIFGMSFKSPFNMLFFCSQTQCKLVCVVTVCGFQIKMKHFERTVIGSPSIWFNKFQKRMHSSAFTRTQSFQFQTQHHFNN